MNKKWFKILALLTLVFSCQQNAGVLTVEGTFSSRNESILVLENGVEQIDKSKVSTSHILPVSLSMTMEFDFTSNHSSSAHSYFDDVNGIGYWDNRIRGSNLVFFNPFGAEFNELNKVLNPNYFFSAIDISSSTDAHQNEENKIEYSRVDIVGFLNGIRRVDYFENGLKTYINSFYEIFEISIDVEVLHDYKNIEPPTYSEMLTDLLNRKGPYIGKLEAFSSERILNNSTSKFEAIKYKKLEYYGDFTMSFDASAEERALLTANPVSEPSVFALLMLSGLILYRRK